MWWETSVIMNTVGSPPVLTRVLTTLVPPVASLRGMPPGPFVPAPWLDRPRAFDLGSPAPPGSTLCLVPRSSGPRVEFGYWIRASASPGRTPHGRCPCSSLREMRPRGSHSHPNDALLSEAGLCRFCHGLLWPQDQREKEAGRPDSRAAGAAAEGGARPACPPLLRTWPKACEGAGQGPQERGVCRPAEAIIQGKHHLSCKEPPGGLRPAVLADLDSVYPGRGLWSSRRVRPGWTCLEPPPTQT